MSTPKTMTWSACGGRQTCTLAARPNLRDRVVAQSLAVTQLVRFDGDAWPPPLASHAGEWATSYTGLSIFLGGKIHDVTVVGILE